MRAFQGSVIPAVPEGAPPWVYVVAVVAGLLVVLIGALPTIIEKLKPTPTPTPPPAVPDRPGAGPQQVAAADGDRDRNPPTDTLRAMILDLQGRLTRSEQREDALQERLLEMTRKLATAEAEIAQLRSQVQVLSMRRD